MRKVIIILISVFSLIFFNCKNFTNATELKKQIEEKISYASTEHFSVISFYPKDSITGSSRNSAVIINFDQALTSIKDSDFQIFDEEGNLVSYSEKNDSALYAKPELSADARSVRIDPLKDSEGNIKIKPYIGELINFRLVINSSLKSSKGAFLDKNSTTFSFNINSSSDSTAPEISNGIVIKTDYIESSSFAKCMKELPKIVTEGREEDSIASVIYLNCSIFDSESGVSKLVVSMKRKNDVLYQIEKEYFAGQISSSNDGYYSLKNGKIDLADFEKVPDGNVDLQIFAEDFCGNKSKSVILNLYKDTVCDDSKVFIYSKNDESNGYIDPYTTPLNLEKQNRAVQSIYWSQASETYNWYNTENTASGDQNLNYYEISFGNDENHMSEFTSFGIEKSKNNYDGTWTEYCYTFENLDETKDTYVWIKCWDTAGNESVRRHVIPAAPDVSAVSFNEETKNYNIFVKPNSNLPVSYEFIEGTGHLHKCYRVFGKKDDEVFLIRSNGNNSLNYGNFIFLTIPSGFEEISVQEIYVNVNQSYYDYFFDNHAFIDFDQYLSNIPEEDFYFPINRKDSSFYGFGNYAYSQISDFLKLSESTVLEKPVIESVTFTAGEEAGEEYKELTGPNSRKCLATINIKNYDPLVTYTYFMAGSIVSKTNKLVVPVEGGYFFVAAEKNGEKIVSDMFEYSSTDISVDTEPPSLWISSGLNYLTMQNYSIPLFIRNEYGSLQEDMNGFAFIDYYDVPVDKVAFKESLSDEEKSKYSKATFYFKQPEILYHNVLEVYLPIFNYDPDKNYCAYIDASDNMGNTYSEYAGKFIYSYMSHVPTVTFDSLEESFHVSSMFPYEEGGSALQKYFLDHFNPETNEWLYNEKYFEYSEGDSYEFSENLPIDIPYYSDTFYRYSEFKCYYANSSNDYIYTYLYGKPVYVFAGESNCKVKFMVQGSGCVKIEHDQPVLVHTLYAKKNLGNHVYDWEMRGKEQSCRQFNVASKGTVQSDYYQISDAEYAEENIPDGYYYTVITWFADGTYQMTKPEQF